MFPIEFHRKTKINTRTRWIIINSPNSINENERKKSIEFQVAASIPLIVDIEMKCTFVLCSKMYFCMAHGFLIYVFIILFYLPKSENPIKNNKSKWKSVCFNLVRFGSVHINSHFEDIILCFCYLFVFSCTILYR